MEYVKDLKIVSGNPVLDSLDGSKRAPLRTILSKSWTDTDRAEFGVYSVDTTVPAAKVWDGDFVEVDGKPVANFRDPTPEEILASVPWQNATEARKAVVQWINGLTAQIEELYPSAVQKRWEIEESAARAVKAGTADARQLALVTDEGAAKGRTPEEHATAIIANADRFRSIADQTNKLFLATDAKLQAAQSPLEYPAIFAWAQSQAAPLAAAYGLST